MGNSVTTEQEPTTWAHALNSLMCLYESKDELRTYIHGGEPMSPQKIKTWLNNFGERLEKEKENLPPGVYDDILKIYDYCNIRQQYIPIKERYEPLSRKMNQLKQQIDNIKYLQTKCRIRREVKQPPYKNLNRYRYT